MSHAIETRDVVYRAGEFEIPHLSMNVPTGSIYGFLGPNGSGKTTTIHLIMALLRPRRGTITVLGEPMPSSAPRVLGRTGFVPERPHLYPSLTVEESLRYHSAFYPGWDPRRVDELSVRFGLEPGRKVGSLSKGETGQLMVLMALAQTPDLLVLDEPTDGLDPVVRRDILTALLDYVSRLDATILVSSHLVHELERVCDWIGLMDDGRMVAEMPMEEFRRGIKRLRVLDAPPRVENPPFALLAREEDGMGGAEAWVVRGWRPTMSDYFDGIGATLKETIDLDLEESFVELLRTARLPAD